MGIRDELNFLTVVLNVTQDIFLILFFPALSHTLSYENHVLTKANYSLFPGTGGIFCVLVYLIPLFSRILMTLNTLPGETSPF